LNKNIPVKIIIAPDKFKGSLTSMEVCTAIMKGLHDADKSLEISFFPMADGGDGFAEVLKYYTGTETVKLQSVDALGRPLNCTYELNVKDNVAIIELASCSGIAMLDIHERDPLVTSTYGTGLQVQHAIQNGVKKILLGIGGSATNDAGIGILSAMGFIFLDSDGETLEPLGKALIQISEIIPPDPLPPVQFDIACDVNNPLYGPEGAAFVFSEQKGATHTDAKLLDEGLRNLASVVMQQTGKNISAFPGAGAAGGIAAGLAAYLPVNVIEGTQLILDSSKIETGLAGTDVIITGEGKIDHQSFRGKTISAICSIAGKHNIPVVAFCGKLELDEIQWKKLGLIDAFEISDGSVNETESIRDAYDLLRRKAKSVFSAGSFFTI
jgi:glycerate kinase